MVAAWIVGSSAAAPAPGPALHIPDGFLSFPVALVMWIVAVASVALAARRSGAEMDDRLVPLMGVMAAFLFAAQMINFPVAGGTSGHLLGGALAGILLGPWAGILVMTAVVGLQALLFQDGGLLVMGANIVNMGIVTVLIGFGLYRSVAGRGEFARLSVAAVAAWLSVMAAALATALQLWLSGTMPLRVVTPAMLAVHALIGVGEAVITVAALAFVARARPDLVAGERMRAHGGRGWAVVGLLVALGVVLLAPFASADPDGLERVAEDLGFLGAARAAPYAILPDYTVPGLGETALSTVLAGAAGALLVAALVVAVARRLRRAPGTPA